MTDRESRESVRRRVARSLPPVARRDSEISELRSEVEQLRAQVGRLAEAARERADKPERWTPPPGKAARQLVAESGLFDAEWYARQVAGDPAVPPLAAGEDAVRHYVRHGAEAGLSPHPAFLPSWYVAQLRAHPGYRSVPRIARSALVHYLLVGARRGLSPHPAMDSGRYLEEHPEAAEAPGGPLGHALGPEGGPVVSTELLDVVAVEPTTSRSPAELREAAAEVGEVLRASRGHLHLERDRPTFDREAEAALKESLLADPLPQEPPLVSIVLPTKDRAHVVGDTIDSVLDQTWQTWELIVVDDGSSDGTAELLDSYDDPRVVVLHHEQARGVAAARNSGLAQARGRYVTYIDSDNTWKPDFLELMMRFMAREGHRVAYAMSALVEIGGKERVLYRGMPFSREALRERNYIDCIVLVHEAGLLEEVGTFDETLRRTVDWDLFVRLADATDFGFLPVIATEYDMWENRNDRITTEESPGYRYLVRQRTLVDWDDLRAGVADRVAGRTSVVVVARDRAGDVLDTVQRCRATATGDLEVVVLDSQMEEPESARVLLDLRGTPGVTVRRLSQRLPLEVARNVGASLTTGEHLVFLAEGAWCEPGWQEPLVTALRDHAAAQPLVLARGGSVWSAGAYLRRNGRSRLLYRGFPGDAPEVRGLRTVDAATAACLGIRASTFFELDGFDPLAVDAWTGGELSARAARLTAQPVACVGASRVALLHDPYEELSASAVLGSRSNDRVQEGAWDGGATLLEGRLAEDGYRVDGHERLSRTDPDGYPVLVHDRPERPLRWALKIGPPDVPARENWGDWHFAEALRDSLERLGHEVSIDCVEDWYRPSAHLDDVSLVIRGLSYYDPNPDHLNLTWVISHPDRVASRELANFDAVFGASERWCRQVSRRLRRPAVPLLQCTDQRRFQPTPADPARRHEVLAVANARGVRPTVAAALEAGVVPDVYGARWEGLLPPGAWKGRYVPNDELVTYYVSAGVVLNDHHEDMRSEGLLSNRLFDLTACGARVLSDHLPEIPDVFGDVVSTWTEPSEIPALVSAHLEETPERRDRRLELSERVRRDHTFDARARTLSEAALAQQGERGPQRWRARA